MLTDEFYSNRKVWYVTPHPCPKLSADFANIGKYEKQQNLHTIVDIYDGFVIETW